MVYQYERYILENFLLATRYKTLVLLFWVENKVLFDIYSLLTKIYTMNF